MNNELKYSTGEPIEPGDRVRMRRTLGGVTHETSGPVTVLQPDGRVTVKLAGMKFGYGLYAPEHLTLVEKRPEPPPSADA